MNKTDVISALCLPDSARVDQRVPKKLLLENSTPTVSDKRLITDAIECVQWFAALKANTIGVPKYHDTQREYLEIAVLAITLRDAVKPANLSRLAELLHRAVPYPVLLLLEENRVEGAGLILSLAHKRWSQNEASKVVLDGDLVAVSLGRTSSDIGQIESSAGSAAERAFVQSLAISRQSQASLHALYQGWIECVQALHAARRTGNYQPAATPEQAAARRQALTDCERFEREISRLRAHAAKEKQLSRLVEVNLALKRIQAALATAQQQL